MRALSVGCSPLLTLTLTLGAGCAASGVPERQPGTGPIDAPATYTGRLPCADCPGIQLTVTLFPDRTFRLRQVYEDRPAVLHELGRWSVEANDTRLVLRGGSQAPRLFQIVGADSLRMLDTLGRPIESPLSSLVRAARVDPVRDTMRLRGTYTYMADAGRFTECLTGAAFPVAQIGDNAALERAYIGARAEPGAPPLVSFTGHFEERPGMEGDRRIEHVVVDRFDRVWPGATCEEPMPDVTPENTHWKLLDVGGQPARVGEQIAEPYLRLDPAEQRALGSTGCNRFFGRYELSGDSLRFAPLASTRRACLDPELSRQEGAFLEALGATRTWRVAGDTLVLTGEAGPAARFVAQHMR